MSLFTSYKALESLRICVFGAPSVGKSALSVRLLTGRYIGSYSSASPTNTSSRDIKLSESHSLQLFVREVSASASTSEVASHLEWCQCSVVLCSRSDPASLRYASWVLEEHSRSGQDSPVVLVANKADLTSEEKALGLEECQEEALDSGCLFLELSALESSIGCRLLLVTLLSEVAKVASGSHGSLRGGKKPVSLASRRIWMKVFGAMFKNLCCPNNAVQRRRHAGKAPSQSTKQQKQ